MNDRKSTIRDYMQREHAKSWEILSSIEENDLGATVYETDDQEWQIGHVLAHLADSEAGLLSQARRISAGEQTLPDDFDINRWNRSAVRKRDYRALDEHLAEIENAYGRALQFLGEVEPEKLDWRGRHSSGQMLTLEEFFRRIVDHRLEHALDIQRARDG